MSGTVRGGYPPTVGSIPFVDTTFVEIPDHPLIGSTAVFKVPPLVSPTTVSVPGPYNTGTVRRATRRARDSQLWFLVSRGITTPRTRTAWYWIPARELYARVDTTSVEQATSVTQLVDILVEHRQVSNGTTNEDGGAWFTTCACGERCYAWYKDLDEAEDPGTAVARSYAVHVAPFLAPVDNSPTPPSENPYTVVCPTCNSGIGNECTLPTSYGRRRTSLPHVAREALANGWT